METFEISRARRAAAAMIAPTSGAILLCLGLALASDPGFAAARVDRESGQHSNVSECAEGVSRTDCTLWRAYRGCVSRASAEHMTGDGRRAFLDACLAAYHARDLPQLAESPAGIHPRETW